MTLLNRYQDAVHNLFKKIEDTQRGAIIQAGNLVADTIASGGAAFLSSICHRIEYDLLYRGGGPIFYKRLDYKLDVDNPARDRDRSGVDTSAEGLGMYALKASKALPGDLIMLSSVSGRTPKVVDLAWEAKKFGMKVIAFTSMEYARAVEPVHSSGKKFYEMADIVLDNCAPAAEAMLEIDGIEARFAAASGIASDYILWSLTSVAVESLMAKGIAPGILKSANFPGGNDYNKTVVEPNYTKTGY
ncbi:MAG: sugar isomerase domain-containing protein [Oscillospiraceae bacterium]|jgi:uncharacterized phosphosugar-binding protein|nr:sugar isomerase domain-containing protein [Oscillospiraceae bacterium]